MSNRKVLGGARRRRACVVAAPWRWRRPKPPMKVSRDNEIVIGTHQDLSGPIKGWGVPVSNGMKMAIEEINAAGGIKAARSG